MKFIRFLAITILLTSCQGGQELKSVFQFINSLDSVNDKCPIQPKNSLEGKQVKSLKLNSLVTLRNQIAAGRDIGYSFTAKAGQQLFFSTDDKVCIWIVSPDGKIVSGTTNLPLSGRYVMQISTLKGNRTYQLRIGLDLPAAEVATTSTPNPSVPSPSSTQTQQSDTPTPQAQDSEITTNSRDSIPDLPSQNSRITQQDAANLLRNWLQAKKVIFAPPFNREVAAEFTTGALYFDITKPGGSLDWLSENNGYYAFGQGQVGSVSITERTSDRAIVEATLTEDITFYLDGRIEPSQTRQITKTKQYILVYTEGKWKIADYN